MTSPGSRATASDLDGFRTRLRDALSAFDDDSVASWEDRGHVPREVVAELAGRGIFRDRWKLGAERGLPYLIVFSQEASRRSNGLAVAAMGHSEMFIGGLTWLGEGPAQLALLADALDGRSVGCFAATEPDGGSSLADVRTTAAAQDGGWHLRGCKRYICNIGEATHVLVLARLQDAQQASDLSIFIVPVDHPGVSIDGFFRTVGLRDCDVGQITIDAELPREALLGNPGLGLVYASYLLNFERISICAQLLAMAETALRLTISYARQRITGGSRLMDKQAIRHRLANCQGELWNLQSLLDQLATDAAVQDHMSAREIAALKLVAGQGVGRIVDTCLQTFGARGSSSNFPIERLWRDSRLARLGGGTDEVLADLVAFGLDRPDPDSDAALSAYLATDHPRNLAVGQGHDVMPSLSP
jgi:alkylation response protein AidB-like acyl-CoA dehydrogenase